MTQFERAIKQRDIKCDICGKPMIVFYGAGWDNDRIVCTDGRNCGAEIVYPTSTEVLSEQSEISFLNHALSKLSGLIRIVMLRMHRIYAHRLLEETTNDSTPAH